MFSFFKPFRYGIVKNPEVTKPLTQKVFRSLVVLCSAPFARGDKITVDRYTGVVQRMDLWYLKIRRTGRVVYIPTSFIYDKTIEVFE